MLHAPASETKTATAPSKSQFAPQPERELHPHSFSAAGTYAPSGTRSVPSVRSPQAQQHQRLTGMQSTHGNQAVLRIMRSPQQAARLTPLRPSQGLMLQRKCACGGSSESEGECAECKEKREGALQRRMANQGAPAATVPPIVHDVLSSPGQSLDAGTRAFMEPRFGHDFSQVRVHTDAEAAESARAVNALAYTVGRNVVFGMGRYQPGTTEGNRLLAHELAHTVQQGDGALQPLTLAISAPTATAEQQAEQASDSITRGQPFPLTLHGTAQIARQEDDLSISQANAGAADAGGTQAPLSNIAATTCLPTVTLDQFSNSGSTDPRDCQTSGSIGLGVGQSGTGSNGMEMRFTVRGDAPGTQYDILRTRAASLWERGAPEDTGGGWTLLDSQPMGTNDDSTNDDECLTPVQGKIFVVDTPGFPRETLPMSGGPLFRLPNGVNRSHDGAAEVVMKFTFAEWVNAQCADTPWTPVSTPTFVFWHCILWFIRDNDAQWALNNVGSEIALGSILSSIKSPPGP